MHIVDTWKTSSASALVSLGAVLLLWWASGALGLVQPLFVPPPTEVLAAAAELWKNGLLTSDLQASLRRAGLGFVGGSFAGVALGLMTARVAVVRAVLKPFLTFLRPIPAIALVPLAIVWFGIGESSKYMVVSYTVFLSVWLNTHHGAEQVAQTYIRASRSLGADGTREFLEVVLPASAPYIFGALRVGAALSLLSLVAAEMTGASSGVGYRLQEARQFMRTDIMFVGLIELGLLGALLDAVFAALGRRVVHWEQT